MKSSARIALATLALSCATALSAPAAHALSAKECHQNYTAARKAGSLNGQSYGDFKAANCAAAAKTAEPATATTPAEAPVKAEKPTVASTTTAPETAKAAPAAAASAAGVTFPSSVSAQYEKLSAGKARMKTCLDQYNANKTSGGNGSLKWIQKGGGYYSQCNTRLKGE